MFESIKKKVEERRKSKNVFWRFLVFSKDTAWHFWIVAQLILVPIFIGNKFKFVRRNSIKYWIAGKLKDSCALLNYSGKEALAVPFSKLFKPALQGEYLALEGYFKKYIPKKGDVVIDAGAYNGLCTIIFSFLVGQKGRVISFEPDIKSFKILKDNIKIYNLSNVILLNKGLADENSEKPFFSNSFYSSFITNSPGAALFKASTVRLDDQLLQLGIKKVDFIKMDIEGAEVEAIKGADKTLKNNNLHLAIASYHQINGQRTCFELEKALNGLGYQANTGNERHLTTYGWKNN